MEDKALLEQLTRTRVDIPGTANTRDLGGYPTVDGRAIREGVLFRGETLARPSEHAARVAIWRDEEVDRYRSLGLSTVIDLRAQSEAELVPSAWADASAAELVSIPMDEGGEGDATGYMRSIRAGTLRRFDADDLAAFYFRTVRARATEIAQVFTAVAQPNATPVLIHCAAGKDRTGIVVALLLEAFGVRRDVTVADYALTEVFRPNRVRAYAELLDAVGVPHEDVAALFAAPAPAMRGLLEGIDAEYGSVRDFLVSEAELDPEVFGTLAEALLTDDPDAMRLV